MLLGLISDTHGLLRPEVLTAFQRVDHIIHAGDVGDPDILMTLRGIAPVTAVWGNTDGWEVASALPEVARVELGGAAVVVVHGQQYGRPTAEKLADAHPDSDLVVFGHSHQPEILRHNGVLAVNPGSAGPARFTLPVTVALATIAEEGITARLVDLLSASPGR
jgi:uncharacterized protein